MVAHLGTLSNCAVGGRKIWRPRLHSRLHISLLELHSQGRKKMSEEEEGRERKREEGNRGEEEGMGKGREG